VAEDHRGQGPSAVGSDGAPRSVDWVAGFPGAVTVCDEHGVIVEMNAAAIRMYEANGGASLVGRSVLECHPEPARTKVEQLLRTWEPNVYTVEKDGIRKLVHQGPWFRGGQFGGLIELAFEIPWQMPHFVRDVT
jgi:PAS domain-containing protein